MSNYAELRRVAALDAHPIIGTHALVDTAELASLLAEHQGLREALARISQHDGFPTSAPSWRDIARDALAAVVEK